MENYVQSRIAMFNPAVKTNKEAHLIYGNVNNGPVVHKLPSVGFSLIKYLVHSFIHSWKGFGLIEALLFTSKEKETF